jgi:hypothetical protein
MTGHSKHSTQKCQGYLQADGTFPKDAHTLKRGSSKHGNAFRAATDSNCVLAMVRSNPSSPKYLCDARERSVRAISSMKPAQITHQWGTAMQVMDCPNKLIMFVCMPPAACTLPWLHAEQAMTRTWRCRSRPARDVARTRTEHLGSPAGPRQLRLHTLSTPPQVLRLLAEGLLPLRHHALPLAAGHQARRPPGSAG